jgi:hypothetical protein
MRVPDYTRSALRTRTGVRVRQQGRLARREEGFQEQDGGELIDVLGAGEAGRLGGDPAGVVEQHVGVAGGEALIEQVMRERGMGFAERCREGGGLGGLRARVTVGVEWVADDDDLD